MREYKNKAEGAFKKEMEGKGWDITKRGWPDFICLRDDDVVFVEVKKNKDIPLKKSQLKIMKILADHGIPCFRWSPDLGFETIK